MELQRDPVETISAVTLLTADMAEAVAFYEAPGFHLLYGARTPVSRASGSAPATSIFNPTPLALPEGP